MNSNPKIRYIPILIAVSIVAGIFIGTFYANRFSVNNPGLGGIQPGTNKLNGLLRIVNDQYVDTVNMADLVEEAMPQILLEGRRVINNIQRAATLFLVKNIFSLALSIITLFTNWPYPIVPLHLSMISALTIGIPSFFLAMEPNYERIRGRFLRGVLRRAFPGGLSNVFVVLAAQTYKMVFGFSDEQTATICAGVLGVVGLMVLFQVCKPFGKFRKIIWGAMAAALVVCFTVLGNVFDLRTGTVESNLVFMTLLMMAPTVFIAMLRIFDLGDQVYLWAMRKLEERSKQ